MIGQKNTTPTARKCTIIAMCPVLEPIRKSKIGVKYSAYRLAMNSGIVNAGCVMIRMYRLCSNISSSSRGPLRPLPRGGQRPQRQGDRGAEQDAGSATAC